MSLFNKAQVLERAGQIILKEQIRSSVSNESVVLDSMIKSFSVKADSVDTFDIFLSHSYQDKKGAVGLKNILEEDYGYSVYIDWINDQDLDRSSVSSTTAERLKNRMRRCKCLFYATSTNSNSSKWMPWETGLMDGLKNRVAICPFLDNSSVDLFTGQEYLGIYPYVAEGTEKGTNIKKLWIHINETTYVQFDSWLTGNNPKIHS